jgi:hypothetical protein
LVFLEQLDNFLHGKLYRVSSLKGQSCFNSPGHEYFQRQQSQHGKVKAIWRNIRNTFEISSFDLALLLSTSLDSFDIGT